MSTRALTRGVVRRSRRILQGLRTRTRDLFKAARLLSGTKSMTNTLMALGKKKLGEALSADKRSSDAW
jgi:hypothetical protein